MKLLTLTATLALALLLAACDGNGGGGNDTDTDVPGDTLVDTADTDVPVDTVTDTGSPPCMTPDTTCLSAGCHAPPFDISCVGGTAVTETGDPVPDQPVVACTAGACYFGRSDSTGFWTVEMPAGAIEDLSIYYPVADRPHHSPFCHYTELCDGEIRFCDDFPLYSAPTSGEPLHPAPDPPTDPDPLPTDITVSASDGAFVVFHAGDEISLPFMAERWIALTRFPIDEHVPCFIDPANLPLALYVITPIDIYVIEPGTRFEPVLRNASLDLPNETGLAAGTAIDVYAVGGIHPTDAGIAEGEWARLAGATVSTDGTRIQTATGEGLPYFTWFGIYEAP
jgi:hypothetical protein